MRSVTTTKKQEEGAGEEEHLSTHPYCWWFGYQCVSLGMAWSGALLALICFNLLGNDEFIKTVCRMNGTANVIVVCLDEYVCNTFSR
jgi:hypothetical protein